MKALLACEVHETDIGIISPYRAQVQLLSFNLKDHPLIDISTVDKYQGRDKVCVIVSLVRNNKNKSIGQLLQDWRRLNVAFTRAKRRLLVVGSRDALDSAVELRDFFKILDENSWVYTPPSSILEQHGYGCTSSK